MNTDCRRSEEVNAYIAGELSPRQEDDFEKHLAICAACQSAEQSSRRLISRLLAVPEQEPTRDLVPDILARIREEKVIKPRFAWPRVAAVAAAAAVAVLAAIFSVRETPEHQPATAASVSENTSACNSLALDWFVRAQESDGSWNAERWGGQANYAPALTALPLLALVVAEDPNPARAQAIDRAVGFLLGQQNADGTFGPAFQGTPYNTSISTFALLQAWKHRPNSVPKSALDLAIASLTKEQTKDGGWGYPYSPLADSSITQWHLQSIELAAHLGWDGLNSVVDRGLAWVTSHNKPLDDSAEPADSTSAMLAHANPASNAGTLDFYQTYFVATHLKHEQATTARKRLAELRKEVLRHQSTAGADSGSWPPDDQWGRAGGRLYSTALASLALADFL